MRSLLLGTAVAVAIASPAYANKGVDIMSKRLIEAKQRAINAGYTAITFAEFKAGADGFVAKGTEIALLSWRLCFRRRGERLSLSRFRLRRWRKFQDRPKRSQENSRWTEKFAARDCCEVH